MCICSLDGCNNKCFEQEDKCILHCEKDENNHWYKYNKSKRKWDTNKVKLFWKYINDLILDESNTREEYIEIDNDMKKAYNYEHFKYKFEKVIFPISISDSEDDISFDGLNNNININFFECTFLSVSDFSLLNKAGNVNFSECEFFENIEFQNIEFKNQFLFESCIVHKKMNFINIIFKDITSFMNSEFYKELNFVHSRFEELAIFNLLKGGKLFLKNTFFREEVNFLSIDITVDDRETARIIKNAFEKENNIIEANKFYALEMNEREKELNEDIKEGKNIFEWIVFKFHSISSEHSQNWILSLFWIINFTFLFSHLYIISCDDKSLPFLIPYTMTLSIVLLIIGLYLNEISTNIKSIFIFFFTIFLYYLYGLFSNDFQLIYFSKLINPFSIMTKGEDLTFSMFLYKIVIAYLIYQFIVSVRQNTRRK